MVDALLAQDGAGQPPAEPAVDFASKDDWLAPMKFTSTSSEDAQLWWSSFQLYKNFKELTDRRALAMFPLMLKDVVSRTARCDKDGLGGTSGRI